MDKLKYRVVIEFTDEKGVAPMEIHSLMVNVLWGNVVPSETMMSKWPYT